MGVYNVTLHPLRGYPGPLLWRAYRLPWTYATLSGRWPFTVHKLHHQYGHVVRVAPDELSYTDSRALKAIYGHHNPATEGYSEFNMNHSELLPSPHGIHNILAASTEDHGRARRLVNPSFSEKKIREMQPRIQSYVDRLIACLKETIESGVEYINILQWCTITPLKQVSLDMH